MTKAGKSMVAALAALALLGGVSGQAKAAQCGNGPAGFEAWKQAFSGEARAKGVGAAGISALMGTTYAQATINADRSLRSFKLSLDAFLVKRGAAAIVARGKTLKRSQAALFSSIEARYGVPPGPLIAIWGMESGFGSQRGNQNMLSSIATLAYDYRDQRPRRDAVALLDGCEQGGLGLLQPAPASDDRRGPALGEELIERETKASLAAVGGDGR